MTQQQIDETYMRRCLQLAANGRQNAKPNPMVGAVIVAGGRIIGEGYHVRCGEGHAEVNAFASVRPEDEALLPQATLYVSLEPCAHYGKTPPCADLIVRKGVRRVVVGCVDPFARVHGRGIARIREAGISVTVGVLEAECLALNSRFITVNTLHRPYIILKWAQCDAILVGHTTYCTDRPSLDVRHWYGPAPLRLLLTARPDVQPEGWLCCHSIDEALERLREKGCQSLLVEGGARTLQQFADAGLWDEIRRETSPMHLDGGTPAPRLPHSACLSHACLVDGNLIETWKKA